MRARLFFALFTLTAASLARAASAELTVTVKGAAKGEPVADAVVSLIPLDGAVVPPPAADGEIAQQDQEFSPYVTIVQVGSKIVFPNRDKVQHHVYSLSKTKKFELPLYNPGQAESIVFESAGLVTLGCNIHDWMLAYIVVVPTPWFAKSNPLGLASVTAPAGRYRLEVWHPRLAASVTQDITLADDEHAKREFTLTLKPDRRIRRTGTTKSGGY